MNLLAPAALVLALALLALAVSVSWLALELRLVRCGKIAPKVLTALESLPDRMDTYHLDHQTNPRADFAS